MRIGKEEQEKLGKNWGKIGDTSHLGKIGDTSHFAQSLAEDPKMRIKYK